ncbi:MAG: FAD:protein FMN transferase [Telluria sp.]
MIRRAQPWLGTMVEISVEGTDDHDAVSGAFAAVARVHALMSFHDAASDVSRLNRADMGELVEVDRDTWEVLRIAGDVAALSGGAFDIGCAARLVEWRMLPPPQAQAPHALPGAEVLALEAEGAVRKLAPGWIDLGGIAKGYAVDRAVEALQRAGVPGGCVNAGGDLRAFGTACVPVIVRSPATPGSAGATLTLSDTALATSGSYFSATRRGAGMVSALVDARDGHPIVAERSASVRASRCVLADALTKVVLATGDVHHPALASCGATAFLV